MLKNFIKQNRGFFLAVLLLLILLGSVIYFSGERIYNNEENFLHQVAFDQLYAGREAVQVYLSVLKQDLLFLQKLAPMRRFVNSGLKSPDSRRELEKIFFDFADLYQQYYQIRVLDLKGQEQIKIDNLPDGKTRIATARQMKNKADRYYFKAALKLKENQIYVSPIDLDTEKVPGAPEIPVLRLATSLFNDHRRRTGVLVLNLYISRILELLSPDMFIQTAQDKLIQLKGKVIYYHPSKFYLPNREGDIPVSDVETLHYLTLEFLPGRSFILAMRHFHPALKASLYRIVWISLILFAFFTLLIFFISYKSYLRYQEMLASQKAIIFSLVDLAEGRDRETGTHLERTRNYAVALARQMTKTPKFRKILNRDFLENLYDAALLHDIGKVAVRDKVLLKEGTLDDLEYGMMKQHVQLGGEIIDNIINRYKIREPFFFIARNIAAYHHEKFDGTGYLKGLKGEEIPLEARLFALSDAYDAIRSKRPYKPALSHQEALEKIKISSGTHFDPKIVEAFLAIQKEFEEISEKYA